MSTPTNPQQPQPEGTPAAAPALDARSLDRGSYQERLRQLGVGVGEHTLRAELIGNDVRPQVDPRVVAAGEAQAAAERQAREAQLAPGAIDGRSADPEAVRARLHALGVHEPTALQPAPKQAQAQPMSPIQQKAQRQAELEAARKSLLHKIRIAEARRFPPLNTHELTTDEFAIYAEMRGLNTLALGTIGASGSATY